jgi:hypothetical protein
MSNLESRILNLESRMSLLGFRTNVISIWWFESARRVSDILYSMKSLSLPVFLFKHMWRLSSLFLYQPRKLLSMENVLCFSLLELFLTNYMKHCWKIQNFATMGLVFPNFRAPNLCALSNSKLSPLSKFSMQSLWTILIQFSDSVDSGMLWNNKLSLMDLHYKSVSSFF